MNQEMLRKELVRDEGLRLSVYRDTNGFYTIGVGHLLGTTSRMSLITNIEAMALLDSDIRFATALARECVPSFDQLNDVRQRALVNMAFNRGGYMKSSTTITPAINKAAESNLPADWSIVSSVIKGSPWAKQVGDRAVRLAQMLETGESA